MVTKESEPSLGPTAHYSFHSKIRETAVWIFLEWKFDFFSTVAEHNIVADILCSLKAYHKEG